ncbi:MAG: ECF-type sigma factor [Gemmataceae bacterium]
MSQVTNMLNGFDAGDAQAATQLFPHVYDELRKIAAIQMSHERPGQTLNATALVHEAYLRLIGDQKFENRRHFFAAIAEAMRRILVDAARRRASIKRGGQALRQSLDNIEIVTSASDEKLLSIHEVLDEFARTDPDAATLVKLRFFCGMTMRQVADTLGISVRSAHDLWSYSRSWLRRALRDS